MGAATNDREQAELVRAVYRNIPAGALCMLFGVAALAGGLYTIAPERLPRLSIWLGLSAAILAAQFALWGWGRLARGPGDDWRAWRRRLMAVCLADGARWGLATLWLAAPGAADQQVWICMIVGGAACASVGSLGSYTPAYYPMLFPAMVPYVLWAAFIPDPRYQGVAGLGAILTGAMVWLSRRQSLAFADAVRLRFENLDLAEDLARQKELAEQANLAKTRFLAAASHDLRQPMHALGLFVAALSRTRLPPEGERLASQIAETADALGELFGSLLDISQLDAGLVRAERQAFEIEPLLARLCREQAADLARRPVALRRVATSAVVETDPLLLERMLRNLIANAVRHTAKGRVLVGCRRRGGRLAIEVWDTGPGIAPEHQQQVFEEYYQLGNPERDRAKGLGLGLAITRRLAQLLDCPLSLRSRPGRGSVFAVEVPRGESSAAALAAPALTEAPAQGRVAVIDDEPMVRQSMAELLGGWGYRVATAGSAEELLADLDGPPDLLICDWRLRGGETGMAAIARVRAALGAETPALLITGDTAPERLREAHDTGLVLLHKPVAPGKLRAAVGNLAGRRPAPQSSPAARAERTA